MLPEHYSLPATLFALLFSLLPGCLLAEVDYAYLEIDDETEISIAQYGESGNPVLIWFACNQGEESIEAATAVKLLDKNYQVFIPDMLSAHFLSATPSDIDKVKAEEVEEIIEFILANTSAPEVYLLAGARAAVPVLKGLARDGIKQKRERLKGAMFISPRIGFKPPEPGMEPIYIDEAGAAVHPIHILEGERTPNRWSLPQLKQKLSNSGSKVSSELIPGVRGFFYIRNEKSQEEQELTLKLDQLIDTEIRKFVEILR